jgi:hypothetical protein
VQEEPVTPIHEKLTAIGAALDAVPLDSYADMSPAELAQAQATLMRLGDSINALRAESRDE